MKINYSVYYSKKSKRYVLYKEIEGNHSLGLFKVIEGTRNECYKERKKLIEKIK